jgi:hypothetical protein
MGAKPATTMSTNPTQALRGHKPLLIAALTALTLSACNAAPQQTGAGASAPKAEPTSAPAASGPNAVARGGVRGKATSTANGSGQILLPGEATGTAVQIASAGNLKFEIARAAYDVSGMPKQGCSDFDNKTPARRFSLSMNVTNNSDADMVGGEWGAAAFVGDKRVTLCLASADSGLPTLKKSGSGLLDLVAFVGPDESISALSITAASGETSKVCFDQERVVACK